jgi:hypothetical protein
MALKLRKLKLNNNQPKSAIARTQRKKLEENKSGCHGKVLSL